MATNNRFHEPANMELEVHGNGAPFSITRDKKAIFLESIRSGNYISTACRLAGIRKDVFLDWMCKGGDDRYTRAVAPEDAIEPYKSFVEDVRRAEAEAESNAVAELRKAGKTDWKASEAFLKTRFSSRWSRRDNRADRQDTPSTTAGQVIIVLPDNGRSRTPDGSNGQASGTAITVTSGTVDRPLPEGPSDKLTLDAEHDEGVIDAEYEE